MKLLVRRVVFCLVLSGSGYQGLRGNNSTASAVVIDQNQKLVLVGVADNGTNNVFALTRLNLDASYDTTFNPLGTTANVPGQVVTDVTPGNDSAITAAVIDSENRIVVAGTTVITSTFLNSTTIGSNTKFVVARYLNDGTLDPTFNASAQLPGGPGLAVISVGIFDDTPFGIALDSLGNIIVVGTSNTGSGVIMAIVRLTPEGNLDPTFNSQIIAPPVTLPGLPTVTPGIAVVQPGIQTLTINGEDVATCVTVGNNNSIFVAGYTSTDTLTEVALAKILTNGMLDPTFFNQTTSPFPGVILQKVNGVDDEINAIGIDVNQSLVLGGFTTINGFTTLNGINSITDFLIVRYTQEGVLFETVQTNINGSDSAINALTFDHNNNIIVSGSYNTGLQNFNYLSGTNLAFVTARYTLAGSLDPTFNPLALEGSFNALPGIVITNVVPTTNISFASNDNEAFGVVVDSNNLIYSVGYSNGGTQTDFTTVSYLTGGGLNVAGFNANAQQTGSPGIAENIFFGVQEIGNGVPLILGGDVSGMSPQLLDELRANAFNYVIPVIFSEGPLITNEMQPTLNGIASPYATITLLVNDIPMTTVLADYKGNWSATLMPLLDGTYSVVAISTEPVTGINLASQPVSLTISTEAPVQPTIETPAKEQVIRTAVVSIAGTAQPKSLVSIFIGENKIGEATAKASGKWSFETAPLKDGPQQVYAVAVDKAGNESIPSEIISFMIDTGRPRAPRILSPKAGATVRKSPLTLSGEGKPNSKVNIYANEKLVGTTQVTKQGRWFFKFPVKEGDYALYATAAANRRLSSEIVKVTVDLTPSPVTSKKVVPGKGLFSGTAKPGTAITLFLDGSQFAKVITDELGTWSYNPPPDHPLEKGRHLLKVSITDSKGNVTSLVDREVTL